MGVCKTAKGGETLGNKESSEEEEEVIPAMSDTPGVRPLTPGASCCDVLE